MIDTIGQNTKTGVGPLLTRPDAITPRKTAKKGSQNGLLANSKFLRVPEKIGGRPVLGPLLDPPFWPFCEG